MKLRCKDGDIAIVTRDYPECQANLGRLVEVGGPASIVEGHPSWSIRPVDPTPYQVMERPCRVVAEVVTWRSGVSHPDAWMVPVRGVDEPKEGDVGEAVEAGAEGMLADAAT